MGPPLPPPVVSDKTRFNQVCRPMLPLALRPIVPPPLVVAEDTWVIRGKDGTYLGYAFGDGHKVSQINLYDHLPANRVPHLGNVIISLTGILPDAIGIDIGASVGSDVRGPFGSSGLSALGGVNILWHTRGEGDRKWYPEVHVYYGYSGSFSFGTVFSGLSSVLAPNASAAVQIILAWAREYDKAGVGRPAKNAWIANGYNWTGTFWSVGLSVPVPPRFNLVGSYFQSVRFRSKPVNTSIWRGVSFGIGVSSKFKVTTPFIKLDVQQLFNLKDMGINQSETEYGLVFGNGNDFIPAAKNRKQQSIDGWQWPVNQNKYPQ